MASKAFERLSKNIKPENRQFVTKNLAICRQVRHILDHHQTINTQKKLAVAMDKGPSEISKWLSGLHNIGLENITRMEAVLGCDIILTDELAKEKYKQSETGGFEPYSTFHASNLISVYIGFSIKDQDLVYSLLDCSTLKKKEHPGKSYPENLELAF
jgi:hypothetical protein